MAGLCLEQGDNLAVQWLSGMVPQGFQTQKKHQALGVFVEDLEETVEQLVGDAGFFLRMKG